MQSKKRRIKLNKLEKMFNNMVSHYNHDKYWKMKFKLQNNKLNKLVRYYYLFRMKKMDAFNSASLGNRINGGSYFKSIPNLPHGIKGIFINDKSVIGKNVTIFQQVTIGAKDVVNGKGPTIGNNVYIGAGAKIIGDITVGNDVKIGANAIVVENIPDGATVVRSKPRVIIKKDNKDESDI